MSSSPSENTIQLQQQSDIVSISEYFFSNNRTMSTKKFTCKEALDLLFANPDSEGENLPSEDDGQVLASAGASCDASLPHQQSDKVFPYTKHQLQILCPAM